MFDPNPLYYKMAKAYSDAKKQGKRLIICNEGSSRSSKTFSAFDLIITICDNNKQTDLDIYILRDTLVNCRDYTYKDFNKILKIDKLHDKVRGVTSPKPYYNLYGNNIYFRGLDDEKNTEGYPSDILFFNEGLEMEKSQCEGLIMRCSKLIIFDWNPKMTQHWLFDLEGQPDVIFFRSTFKENKHLDPSVKKGIEAYEPTEENIKNGTANLFRWRVYGLGLRTDQEGNVFSDSLLNKFELSEINLSKAVIVAYCDVADQGIDYMSFVIGALIDEKIYFIDCVFTAKPLEYWMPLVIEKLKQYNIQKTVFESNNQGLVVTKFIKDKIGKPLSNTIVATPNTHNKHSRIVIQAETNIIPNFYFLKYHNGMYSEFMNFLLSYKHDKSFKQDDAPDSLAGLSILSLKIK